jgi:hypothetical protein
MSFDSSIPIDSQFFSDKIIQIVSHFEQLRPAKRPFKMVIGGRFAGFEALNYMEFKELKARPNLDFAHHVDNRNANFPGNSSYIETDHSGTPFLLSSESPSNDVQEKPLSLVDLRRPHPSSSSLSDLAYGEELPFTALKSGSKGGGWSLTPLRVLGVDIVEPQTLLLLLLLLLRQITGLPLKLINITGMPPTLILITRMPPCQLRLIKAIYNVFTISYNYS